MLGGMRTLQVFRKRLGAFAEKFTDAELEQLLREIEVMAQLLVDLYLADNGKRGRLDARLSPCKMGGKGRNLKTELRG
jgi:hypothetical protein